MTSTDSLIKASLWYILSPEPSDESDSDVGGSQEQVVCRNTATQVEKPKAKATTSTTKKHKTVRFCRVEGCTSQAKRMHLCWRHGGSVGCRIPNCPNRAKIRGLCLSHGGGLPCTIDNCQRLQVSNGKCWAHGGGKRCRIDGCLRAAYVRTQHYCYHHFNDLGGERTRTTHPVVSVAGGTAV